MKKLAQRYFEDLIQQIKGMRATDLNGKALDFNDAIEAAAKLIVERSADNKKLMFIGNGASAAISSHMSTDFWKNGGMKAVAFNDSSLLTCMGNDYGYGHVFEKPVEMFADKGDILMAISSSGKSENILLAVGAARKKGCGVMTFSGFAPDNPLSKTGDFNFYVPSGMYGPVETLHQGIIHCILDVIMEARRGR